MPRLLGTKENHRPQYRGWCPGDYLVTCLECQETFIGDKRATQCADCAYSSKIEDTALEVKKKLDVHQRLLDALRALPLDHFITEDVDGAVYVDHDRVDPADYKDHAPHFDQAMRAAYVALRYAEQISASNQKGRGENL